MIVVILFSHCLDIVICVYWVPVNEQIENRACYRLKRGHITIKCLTILAHVVNEEGKLSMSEAVVGKPKDEISLK